MLLQSWGTRRVFPAVSDQWPATSFRTLRAEGGFALSAERRDGATVNVRIATKRSGTVRLHDPFGGRPVRWNRPDVRREGPDYVVRLGP